MTQGLPRTAEPILATRAAPRQEERPPCRRACRATDYTGGPRSSTGTAHHAGLRQDCRFTPPDWSRRSWPAWPAPPSVMPPSSRGGCSGACPHARRAAWKAPEDRRRYNWGAPEDRRRYNWGAPEDRRRYNWGAPPVKHGGSAGPAPLWSIALQFNVFPARHDRAACAPAGSWGQAPLQRPRATARTRRIGYAVLCRAVPRNRGGLSYRALPPSHRGAIPPDDEPLGVRRLEGAAPSAPRRTQRSALQRAGRGSAGPEQPCVLRPAVANREQRLYVGVA